MSPITDHDERRAMWRRENLDRRTLVPGVELRIAYLTNRSDRARECREENAGLDLTSQ